MERGVQLVAGFRAGRQPMAGPPRPRPPIPARGGGEGQAGAGPPGLGSGLVPARPGSAAGRVSGSPGASRTAELGFRRPCGSHPSPQRLARGPTVAGPAMPPNKESLGRPGSPAALICLPPISEDLQLVWTQASQTSELDGHQPLHQAFNYFPYPSLADLALLCLRHGLQLEKVKAWFMAQRLRCGISWSAEEIEETRARLACRQDRPAFGALLAPSEALLQAGRALGGREAPTATPHKVKLQESPGTCAAVAQGAPEPGRASAAPYHKAKETPPPPPSLFPTPPPPCRAWADPLAGASHPDTAWDLSKPCRLGAADSTNPLHAASPSSGATVNGAEAWARPGHPHGTLEAQRQRKSRRKTKEQLAVLKSFFLRCQWARREDYQWLEQITGLPRAEIIQWFGDTRYALKHGHLRWFWDNSVPVAPEPGPRTDTGPLERYWAARQQLREDDLPALSRESGMETQQVLNWFYSRSPEPAEVVVCLGEEQEDEDEEAGLMVQEEGEEEEDELEEEDLGAQE
ncbi:homeobox and leucine zipper protein Homez isoform X2 [Pelodiscus sinensis]|uniref:homeobox and leucine zipper protein Homez isoform X2 n=1 Tax=Pelodiscus sinensis TaxID=13735 RepID=UPI003F6BE3F8